MSQEIVQPPRCHSCAAVLHPPGNFCGHCRADQRVQPMVTVPAGPAKSAVVAVLLSFLWLGAGHLYVGRTTAGVLLMIFDLFLVLLSLSGFGLLVAVPVWLISVVIVMITAGVAAGSVNRANLVTVPRH